jgi:hypothetical protein
MVFPWMATRLPSVGLSSGIVSEPMLQLIRTILVPALHFPWMISKGYLEFLDSTDGGNCTMQMPINS